MGGKQVSDLIGADVQFIVRGTSVGVSGEVKNIKDEWKEFDANGNNTGHFIPIQMPQACKDKDIKIKGRVGGDRTVHIDEDLLLVQRLENLTGVKMEIEMDGKPFMTVDFAGVVPMGAKAVKAFDQSKSYGTFGKTSEYLSPDAKIEWDGNGATGKVKGTILYYKGNAENTKNPTEGNYLPISLSDWYDGVSKKIKVKNEKVVPEPDIIFTIADNVTPVIITYNGLDVAKLDLSEATVAAKA